MPHPSHRLKYTKKVSLYEYLETELLEGLSSGCFLLVVRVGLVAVGFCCYSCLSEPRSHNLGPPGLELTETSLHLPPSDGIEGVGHHSQHSKPSAGVNCFRPTVLDSNPLWEGGEKQTEQIIFVVLLLYLGKFQCPLPQH